MLRRVQKYMRDKCLPMPGSVRILVCVSGGADSVALLDVLLRSGYECVVAHCNFHLRGEESNRDENFVRQLCATLCGRLYVKDFDTGSYAESAKCGIEEAARNLRYEWFDTLAKETGCGVIAVAHHQNDQAETVLMNIRRGCGLRGLCGMRAMAVNPVVRDSDVYIMRPLLCTTHDYICHYLRDIRHIDWVEDSTNNDVKYKRNAVRNELSSWSKAEIEHICRLADLIQSDEALWNNR